MAVRDPYADSTERRNLPSIDLGRREEQKGSPRSLKERYVDSLGEGAELRGLMQGLGISPTDVSFPGPSGRGGSVGAPQTDAKEVHSVLDIVKAQADTNIKMMDRLLDRSGAKGEDSAFLKYLVEELKAMRSQLDNRSTDPADVIESQVRMVEAIKKSMGITGAAAPAGGRSEWDLKYALEMKKIDIELKKFDMDMAERQQHWQMEQQKWTEDMEERRRRWKLEDKRHEDEMALRRQELNQNGANKDKLMGQLGAVAESLLGSIDNDMGELPQAARGVRAGAPPPPASTVDHYPAKFKCQVCNQMVGVTTQDQQVKKVVCKTCGTAYDLVPQDAPGGGAPVSMEAPSPGVESSPEPEDAEEVEV